MKKTIASSLFLVGLLIGCGAGGSKEKTTREDGLVVDTRENYVFDESVTNVNGSMSYEIFVRSFYDSDGDGIGDLYGIKMKLPYLADLGVKTLWLMPIHKSPTYHGYDVLDYYSVNPDYGSMADFDLLVSEANKYNIDIMLDMVFNHCSIQNQYVIDSYNDKKSELAGNTPTDSKADWFNWNEKKVNSNYSQYRDLYLESRFDASMPDFNLDSQNVRKEIDNICKFWIKDHGVKGFRLDAVLYYYNVVDKNNEFSSFLKETTLKYNKDFYMVGEYWDAQARILDAYKSGLDSFFNFSSALVQSSNPSIALNTLAKGYLSAKKFMTGIEKYEQTLHENNPNGYSSYFLTNHDGDRASDSLQGDYAKLAMSIYGLMPGTPFMYYGEEIGLKGVRKTSPDDFSDVRRRLPLIWSKDDKTGECSFPEKNRMDLSNNPQVELGIEDNLKEGYSLINHYKKVINVRNKYPFLKHGIFTSMNEAFSIGEDIEKYALAYKISLGDEYIVVVTNTDEKAIEINVGDLKIVDEINTVKLIPEISKDGVLRLGASSTVILK